ncbi:hypothetical protein T492DRAFT_1092494 [Pavlovales sp. CCMP2436]|nr:hypothetical protein T492DRAFT_1092494 [Pavlovales sp. CCMP2436]|mmetsp:Transcript_32814/g.81535  ORF Transcript_32814/g.81535 Transcript_32814/m.81535 type:complete len:265 (-) Transcript_32814:158-952(-)
MRSSRALLLNLVSLLTLGASRQLPRRALLQRAGGALAAPSAAALVTLPPLRAAADGESSPSQLIRDGEGRFRAGDVEGSVAAFDAALAKEPRVAPYLWQRGIALYYADKFAEAAEQFRRDVEVNPADVEEALWHGVAMARLDGLASARKGRLRVGQDRRPVLREIYALYSVDPGVGDAAAARTRVEAFAALDRPAPVLGSDAFYARLYLGLLAEADSDTSGARRAIEAALQTEYAASSQDYMVSVARVHAKQRGWMVPPLPLRR